MKAKPWKEVYESEQFQSFSIEEREAARDRYFKKIVIPNTPLDKIDLVRADFYSYTDGIKGSSEKAGGIGRKIARAASSTISASGKVLSSPILDKTKRALGVVFGTANALSGVPALYGGLKEAALSSGKDENFAEQTIAAFKGAYNAMTDSAFKKGSWGTRSGEYYETQFGESIYESLPSSLKWAAPAFEVFAEIIPDPFLVTSIWKAINAKNFAKLGISDRVLKKLPKEFLDDIDKLNKLEGQEKAIVQQKLISILKKREDYINFLGSKFNELEATQLSKNILPAPNEKLMLALPEIKKALIPGKVRKALPPVNRLPIAKEMKKSSIPTSQQLFDVERRLDVMHKKTGIWNERQLSEINRLNLKKKTLIKKSIPEALEALSKNPQIATIHALKKASNGRKATDSELIVSIIKDGVGMPKLVAEGMRNRVKKILGKYNFLSVKQAKDFAIKTNVSPDSSFGKDLKKISDNIENIAKLDKKTLTNANKFLSVDDARVTKIIQKALGDEYKLGGEGVTLRATGGLLTGYEEHEDGSYTYDIKKGLTGAMFLSLAPRFIKTKKIKKIMSKYPSIAKLDTLIGETIKEPFSLPGLWGRFNTKFLDRITSLKKVSPGLEGYNEAVIHSSYKDVAKLEFNKLVKGFNRVRNDEVIMTKYITAHRASDRLSRGIKTGKLTLTDAKQAIADLEKAYAQSGKNPTELKNALQTWKTFTDESILKAVYDGELISKTSYLETKKNNKWYAAFDVLDYQPRDVNNIPALKSSEYYSIGNRKILQRMVGTEKKFANPIISTIDNFLRLKQTIARNKVAIALIDSDKNKKFFRPVAVNNDELMIMKAKGFDPVMDKSWDPKLFDSVNRFKKGHFERYIAPIEIADAMKHLSVSQAPSIIALSNRNFQRSATSAWIPFTIRNIFRDTLMAYTTSPVFSAARPDRFMMRWTQGLWEGIKFESGLGSEIIEQHLKSGGGFGWVGEFRKSKMAKEMLFSKSIAKTGGEIVTSPLTLVEKLSAAGELSSRIAIRLEAINLGYTPKEGALLSRIGTIDFNRGGSVTKMAAQYSPFLNANVQAKDIIRLAMVNDPVGFFSKVAVTTLPAGFTGYAWNKLHYKDLYDDIPQEYKDEYFIFIYGTEMKERGNKEVKIPRYFAIPKGDAGKMLWNPIERVLNEKYSKDPEDVDKFLIGYVADIVSPVAATQDGEVSPRRAVGALIPPIVKGGIEGVTNFNWYTGNAIESFWEKKLKAPELRYNKNTPETFKDISWFLAHHELKGVPHIQVGPKKLQNFANSIFAGYGRTGMNPESMLRSLTGSLVKTTSGSIYRQAQVTILDIEQGFNWTQSYAEEFIKNDKTDEAIDLLLAWNSGVKKQQKAFNKKFKYYEIEDKGGIQHSFTFTTEKIRNIISGKGDKRDWLEKKLTGKRKRR